jgi:hypothetical protein
VIDSQALAEDQQETDKPLEFLPSWITGISQVPVDVSVTGRPGGGEGSAGKVVGLGPGPRVLGYPPVSASFSDLPLDCDFWNFSELR